MGLELAAQVVAGMLLGWLADRFIAKDGYTWLVVGTIAGVLVGMTTFVKTALRESKLAAAAAPKMPRRDLSNEDEDGETED